MKKFTLTLLILSIFFPLSVFAYSDYIIASGENIGIELKANYALIVGSYNIENYNVLNDTELKIGDKITKVNDTIITSAEDMQKAINKYNQDNVKITYIRNNNHFTTNIKLFLEDGEYKTGLYVKDTIRGVATLTYIDEENKKFGALGHEIIEKTTKSKFEMSTGKVFESTVTGITKSENGNPGEKNARSNSTNIYGTVDENTTSGIFGDYTTNIPNSKKYKVVPSDKIELGNAKILTTINGNNVEAFDINILKINKNSKTKNSEL